MIEMRTWSWSMTSKTRKELMLILKHRVKKRRRNIVRSPTPRSSHPKCMVLIMTSY